MLGWCWQPGSKREEDAAILLQEAERDQLWLSVTQGGLRAQNQRKMTTVRDPTQAQMEKGPVHINLRQKSNNRTSTKLQGCQNW